MTSRQDGDWQNRQTADLARAFLALEDGDEVERFLRDLCTLRELDEMGSRWAVAGLLDRGLSYREIADQTGVSTTTITRINHWLQHGTGGYRLVLERLR